MLCLQITNKNQLLNKKKISNFNCLKHLSLISYSLNFAHCNNRHHHYNIMKIPQNNALMPQDAQPLLYELLLVKLQ